MVKKYQSLRTAFFQPTSSRNCAIWISGVFFIPVFFLLSFNIAIDPYYFYQAPLVSGLNAVKPSIGTNALWIKFNAVSRYAPDAVILGMSTARDGYDPLLPAWGPLRAMNLGIGASTAHQWSHFLPYIYSQTDLRLAFVSLNFLAFNAAYESNARLEDGYEDTGWFEGGPLQKWLKAANIFLRGTLTTSAARASFSTLAESRASLSQPSDKQEIKLHFQNVREVPVSNEFRFLEMEQNIEKKHLKISGKPFYFSRDGIDSLGAIKNLIDFTVNKKLNLILVIEPMHVRTLKVIEKLGMWPQLEEWKREISEFAFQAHVPLYDFATVSAVTTEAVPSDQYLVPMTYWHEALHFSMTTGDLILNRALLESNRPRLPGEFGFALTPLTAATHLEIIRKDMRNLF